MAQFSYPGMSEAKHQHPKETHLEDGTDEISEKKMPKGCLGYMGVSKNKGTPKWMVYNGKPS